MGKIYCYSAHATLLIGKNEEIQWFCSTKCLRKSFTEILQNIIKLANSEYVKDFILNNIMNEVLIYDESFFILFFKK